MKKWQTLDSINVYTSKWVSLNKSIVKLPNDIIISDFYTIDIPNAVAIVGITDDNQIILKREYRYAYQRELVEIPAGTFEPDEVDGLNVAKREFLEETGYVSDSWESLGVTIESSSKLTNLMHLFLARNCKKMCDQHLDDTEEIDVFLVSLDEAVNMVMRNEICCNSSSTAILKVAVLNNIL